MDIYLFILLFLFVWFFLDVMVPWFVKGNDEIKYFWFLKWLKKLLKKYKNINGIEKAPEN